MDASLIATTANADLQALGTGGQLAVSAWNQIISYLRRARGSEHADLFAEPNPDPSRGITDWYAEGSGPALPLLDTPEPARSEVRARLTRLVEDIKAEVDTLRASARSSDRFMGDLLGLALQVPDEGSVRVLDGKPVLIAWGHAPVGTAAQPELLLGMLARPVSRAAGEAPMRIIGPPPPKPLPRRQSPWLFAALPIPLLLLLLLLLDPLRWFAAPPSQCAIDPKTMPLLDGMRQEQAREGSLRAELARLSLQLGNRRLACAPVPAPVPAAMPVPSGTPAPGTAMRPPSAATPITPHSDIDRAEHQGARTGKVQIILAWDDENDLDLAVACPNNQKLFFNQRHACGGELDIDRNYAPPFVTDPVENIVFAEPPAPGRYAVLVLASVRHVPAPVTSAFRLTIRIEGRPDRVVTGSLKTGEVSTTQLDMPPP